MPEQAQLTRPEIIAFPGDNAELPAKSLERQIYANPERFQQAMKLGVTILDETVELPEISTQNLDEEKIAKAQAELKQNEELNEAKLLVSDNLKAILEDEKLRRSIWFDDNTEARMEKDEEFKALRKKSPRTESVLKEMRFRQFAIFVDSVVEYKSQNVSPKKNLRRTG